VIPRDRTSNPWTRASRTLAYENDWIQVFHDEVLRPDAQPGVYGVVHPRTHAVGVVAIDDRDQVLLVGQYRYTLDRYSWEIPEGGVPIGEDPLEGARRELPEELAFVRPPGARSPASPSPTPPPTRRECSTSPTA
jgi:hypothetical protein